MENLEDANLVNTGSIGQILEITGNRLSFDKNDRETGVFQVDPATGLQTRTSIYSRIGTNLLNF